MSRKALAVIPALLLAPLATAQSADWRFADPGAQLIGGLDVHAILNSPLVKGALDQVAAKMGDAAPVMQMTLGTLSGVSEVYFSITARKEDPEVVMMIKGTLNDAMVRGFLQGAAGKQPQAAGPRMEIARVDASTVLLSTPALLNAAVHRMERPASASAAPLLTSAKTLAVGNDFWIGGTLPDVPALALIGGGIKGLSLGLSLQQDVRVRLSLSMATAEAAKQMAVQMQKSAGDALRNQAGLDTNVETKVVGSTVTVSSSTSSDQILKVLAEKLKDGIPSPRGISGGGAKQATALSSAVPRPIVPPTPKTIKILGLDEGTKEIPFPSNH